jgi:endoglucanase
MPVSMAEVERLVSARGPAGDEFDVADVFEELVEPHVDDVRQDELGNVVATAHGSDPDAPEMMLAGHTDELSFLIRDVTDDGFLRFSWLGAHYAGNLPGQRVRVGPDEVLGVIGPKSRHRMSEDEFGSLPDDLFIDVGARSAREVYDLGVREGDYATWDREVDELANGRITGRALDDRIALAVLVDVARNADTDATVHYVATVQEEPGLRGAQMTAYDLDPDVAVAVDIFPADHPGEDDEFAAPLGDGPAVQIGDSVSELLVSGVLVNQQTQQWLRDASDGADVDVQWTFFQGGTTDATEFQVVRGGRHAGVVSIPCRYTHSPVETVSMADANETADLLAEAVATRFPTREEARDR